MINHIQQLLNNWFDTHEQLDWVLATIIEIEGSSYRKPGAMMMINSLGQHFGLLSGGCLESDIMRQSRQCWITQRNRIIEYDMREEDDIAWQLGIGCGGMVKILLQPISTNNDYLMLHELRDNINHNNPCKYVQHINESLPINEVLSCNIDEIESRYTLCKNKLIFQQIIKPVLKLAIFGGGIDAIPVVNIAANLGWHVTVIDSRVGYARKVHFSNAKVVINKNFSDISHDFLNKLDAVVIMTHNVKLDAQALSLAQKSSANYVGMLGPAHRTMNVLKEADITLQKKLANPIGLKLGGELPESIALSILSEIHAFIEHADGQSFSCIL